MPENSPSVNTISNSAKLLGAYMKATGITCAKTISQTLDIPIRTVQRLKLECATCANDATGGAAKCANSVTDGVPASAEQIAHVRVEDSARDCKETPTELSSIPQQQQAPDPIESGLLSLLKAEWNLYTDAEAKTSLLGQFRAYGEKHVIDAYLSYLAESKSGRAFVKPWKYIQATAIKMRDAPPPTANVVPMRPTAAAQRPIYKLPTAPVYDTREGIEIDDALRRGLITEEQAAEFRRQAASA